MGLCEGTLIAAYSFDKDTATQVNDVSGNGLNGTGKDTKLVAGKFGSAMEFDGTNSQLEIPHNDKLNIKTAITVEAWVKPTKYIDTNNRALAQKWGDNSNRRQYLLTLADGKVRFWISGSGTADSWECAFSNTSIKAGDWTHIAGTYDSKAIKVYINGKLDLEIAYAESIFASSVPVWIGGYAPDAEFGVNRHFLGVIDEVHFWSGALTDQEIQQGMAHPIAAVNASGKLATKWGALR